MNNSVSFVVGKKGIGKSEYIKNMISNDFDKSNSFLLTYKNKYSLRKIFDEKNIFIENEINNDETSKFKNLTDTIFNKNDNENILLVIENGYQIIKNSKNLSNKFLNLLKDSKKYNLNIIIEMQYYISPIILPIDNTKKLHIFDLLECNLRRFKNNKNFDIKEYETYDFVNYF